jgi:hypothetical protein
VWNSCSIRCLGYSSLAWVFVYVNSRLQASWCLGCGLLLSKEKIKFWVSDWLQNILWYPLASGLLDLNRDWLPVELESLITMIFLCFPLEAITYILLLPVIRNQVIKSLTIEIGTFLLFGGTGFKLRSSHLISKHSTTWVTPSAVFALIIYETGSHFLRRSGWTVVVLWFGLLTVAGITGAHHHAQLFLLRWSLMNCLPRLAWNWDAPDLCLPNS